MEAYFETITQFINELNRALSLKDKEYRNKKIAQLTTQFHMNSRAWVRKLEMDSLDKISIFNNHSERNMFELVKRFNVKAPKIIELSNMMFFERPRVVQTEIIIASLISAFNNVEYYKENNWYPEQFFKDIIVISFLIKSASFFKIDLKEGRLRADITFLPGIAENDFYKNVCDRIDTYLNARAVDIVEDIDVLAYMADSFIANNEINSIDSIIGLFGIMEVNNNRISEMITELMEYESNGVVLNYYLISGSLLKTMMLTISDFPIYLDNEIYYYSTVVKMAIIIKELYKEVQVARD